MNDDTRYTITEEVSKSLLACRRNTAIKNFIHIENRATPTTPITGRHAEVPPSGLPQPDLARARVRMRGGKD